MEDGQGLTFIPMDIVADILSGLSVKTLLRFKCVSKHWYALITTQTFINQHLEKHKLSNSMNVFISAPYVSTNHEKMSYKLYTLDLNDPKGKGIRLQCIPNPNESCTILIGSSNGFVCLRDETGSSFCLFNPSTRTHFMLPSLDNSEIVKRTTTGRIFAAYGFGYDAVTRDYKIVKVVQSSSSDKNQSPFIHTEIMVCSCRNRSWRVYQDSIYHILQRRRFYPTNGTLCNNALHWFSCLMDPESLIVIVRFDLCTEKFHDVGMKLPFHDSPFPVLVNHHGSPHYLTIACPGPGNGVWQMKEYWVNESWCKLCNLTNYRYRLVPVTFSNCGKRLLLQMRLFPGQFYWVDLSTGDSWEACQLPLLDRAIYPVSEPYVETLVALNNFDEPTQA